MGWGLPVLVVLENGIPKDTLLPPNLYKERARLRLTKNRLPNPAFAGGEKPGHVYTQPISASRPELPYQSLLR